MKGFANGIIHSLAFIAILLMQPIGQQYCTAENALCSSGFFSTNDSRMDCCDHHSEENEAPCCVELFSKLPFVPGSEVSLPAPVVLDYLAPESVVLFERLRWNDAGVNKTAEIDPPPRTAQTLAHLCVRLV